VHLASPRGRTGLGGLSARVGVALILDNCTTLLRVRKSVVTLAADLKSICVPFLSKVCLHSRARVVTLKWWSVLLRHYRLGQKFVRNWRRQRTVTRASRVMHLLCFFRMERRVLLLG
jgi:hypothetical protein